MLALMLCVFFNSGSAGASSATDRECQPVEAIFARGSGQDLGASEFDRYRKTLEQYTDNAHITSNIYELGTEYLYSSNGTGYKYPAVPVKGFENGGYQNVVGAWFSGGYGNDYGKSVEDGIKELTLYLNQRFSRYDCQDSRIILMGYSQGAQVIGQMIAEDNDMVISDILGRIDYIALLGDPKLLLPEGFSAHGFAQPAACRDESDKEFYHSVWRRNVPRCEAFGGSLGPRIPYSMPGYHANTGLWCNDRDPVCDSTLSVLNPANDGHGLYVDQGRIDEAVEESLLWVAGKLETTKANASLHAIRGNPNPTDINLPELPYVAPGPVQQKPRYSIDSLSPPCSSLIVINVWQTYRVYYGESYLDDITEDIRHQAISMADLFYNSGCSVEVYSYDSLDISRSYKHVLEPTYDLAAINRALLSIPVMAVEENEFKLRCKMGDEERFEFLFFRDVVIGNRPNPTQSTHVAITGTSDTCGVDYAIRNETYNLKLQSDENRKIHWWGASEHSFVIYRGQRLGLPIEDRQTMRTALDSRAGTSMTTREYRQLPPGDMSIRFPLSTYYPTPGQSYTVRVEPSNPAVTIDEYKLFMWDFDSNGTTDAVTSEPEVSYVYPDDGTLTVTAVTRDDESVKASAAITMWSEEDQIVRPGAPRELTIVKLSDITVEVTWRPVDTLATSWIVQINDSPGQRVTLGDSYKVTIGDIDPTRPLTIHVRGVTADGYLGETTTAALQSDGSTTQDDTYAEYLRQLTNPSQGTSRSGSQDTVAGQTSGDESANPEAAATDESTTSTTSPAAAERSGTGWTMYASVAAIATTGSVLGYLAYQKLIAKIDAD